MGLYDRDYTRPEMRTPWDRRESPRSITVILIVITVGIFFLDMILATRDPESGLLRSNFLPWLAVRPETAIRPWLWWQCLTYGFLHDLSGIGHVLFNMFGLFIFGRTVEQRIGGSEFLKFYLVALLIGGVTAAVYGLLQGMLLGVPLERLPATIGASGAVVAVTILFACYFPQAEILLMFVFPVRAWVLAVLYVGLNILGAVGATGDSNTAFQVHLAGAAFGGLYYFRRWNLAWIDGERLGKIPEAFSRRSRRIKLKLHDPDQKLAREEQDADRILAKIFEQGEQSLTPAERRTLERYSRRKRERRDG